MGACRNAAIVRTKGKTVSRNNLRLPPLVESVAHPTDFSPASDRAFVHALAIALVRQTRLALLHVGMEEHRRWNEFPHVRETLERWKLLKPGSTQEDVFVELGVHVSKHALPGRSPAAALRSYLDRSPVDLLVVATEGHEGLARWLHGSVAETVARWSKTMTLFVPNHAPRGFVSQADGSLDLDQRARARRSLARPEQCGRVRTPRGRGRRRRRRHDHSAARWGCERYAARCGHRRRPLDVHPYGPRRRSGRSDPGGRRPD